MNTRPRFVWMAVLVSLAALSLWTAKVSVKEVRTAESKAVSLECSRHLRLIALGISSYYQDHGTYPPEVLPLSASLKKYSQDKAIFCCPAASPGQDGCYDPFYKVTRGTDGKPAFLLTCLRHQKLPAVADARVSFPALLPEANAAEEEQVALVKILALQLDREGNARIRMGAHVPQLRVLVSPYCFENGFAPADIHSSTEPAIQYRGIGHNVFSLTRGSVEQSPCYELSILQGRVHFVLDTFHTRFTTLAAGESALILR